LRSILVILILAHGLAARAQPAWEPLMPAGAAPWVSAVGAEGTTLVAVGSGRYLSRDGGRQWTPPLAADPPNGVPAGRTSAAVYLHGADAFAAGWSGIWLATTDGWRPAPIGVGASLLAVDGNAGGLVIAVGTEGVIVSSLAGRRFRPEVSGSRATLRAVRVGADGRATAVDEQSFGYSRSPHGRWRRSRLPGHDVYTALALGPSGELFALGTAGHLLSAAAPGEPLAAVATLPLGPRDHCESFAVVGSTLFAGCFTPDGGPLEQAAKEPRMRALLYRSSDGGRRWESEALPPEIHHVAAADGTLYGLGNGLWRQRAPSSAH
jgi:hypothetical protein